MNPKTPPMPTSKHHFQILQKEMDYIESTVHNFDYGSLKWYKVAFYKDAYLFYGAMILLSCIFSLFYSFS